MVLLSAVDRAAVERAGAARAQRRPGRPEMPVRPLGAGHGVGAPVAAQSSSRRDSTRLGRRRYEFERERETKPEMGRGARSLREVCEKSARTQTGTEGEFL